MTQTLMTVVLAGYLAASPLRYTVRPQGPPGSRAGRSRDCRENGPPRMVAARTVGIGFPPGRRHVYVRVGDVIYPMLVEFETEG